ncbi:hypothetical protein EDD18DRAFT_1080193, partial [Armillaria luteobubalina]
AILYTWMEKKDLVDVLTPINGYEWPVPMPKDANLDLVHIEMLNHGAEYAWLDVLCLRQARGQREDLHVEEWKLDVPTIRQVYHESHDGVMCYLSGLGLKEEDLESDRCWFRWAWTLQEVSIDMSICGDTGDDRFISKEMQARIENQLLQLWENSDITYQGIPTFLVLSEMWKHMSTNPVDKVAGLSYLLWTAKIPPYYASQSQEEAWTALVHVMDAGVRGHMLFLYPKDGDRKKCW